MGTLEDMVEPHSMGRIVAAGGAISALLLAGTLAATGWGDVALVATSALLGLGTAGAASVRRRLDQLPLRLAPVGARGIVDGRSIARFRACLGRGRCFVPTAVVTFEGLGETMTLPLEYDSGRAVCGPVLFVVRLPEAEGVVRVDVTGQEGGRTWTATQRYPTGELVEGRFCRGMVPGRSLRFEDSWDQVVVEAEPTEAG